MRRRVVAVALALAFALVPTGARHTLAGVTGEPVDDSYTVNEDTTLVVDAPGVTANDGPAGPTFFCVDLAYVDTARLDGDLDIHADGSFEFTPDNDFNGSTSFTYKSGTSYTSLESCPEGGIGNSATVTLSVEPVNDPPIVTLDATCVLDVTVAEDSGAFVDPARCVEMTFFGPVNENNQAFSEWLSSTNNPDLFADGPTITPVFGQLGALSFTPAPNANGTATVRVRGRDSGGTANGGDDTSARVLFDIIITPANDPPTAGADTFQALPDRTFNVGAPGVLLNDGDIDGDDLTAQKVSDPAHGDVTLAADGSFSYTPDAGFLGLDAFSYRASDGSALSPTRAVTINVTAVPTPIPTVAPSAEPSAAPTDGATLEPSASPDPFASVAPGSSPSLAPFASASLAPGTTPDPVPADDEGGPSIPVLVVGLLLLSLLAFGGAVYLPKWLERQRGGGSIDEGPPGPA